MDLAKERIVTYRAGTPPLTRREMLELIKEIPGWSLSEGRIVRKFSLDNSRDSLAFINDVVSYSEQEGHIPDICMRDERNVEIAYYTYAAGGLTWNDFIMAAKLNKKLGSE